MPTEQLGKYHRLAHNFCLDHAHFKAFWLNRIEFEFYLIEDLIIQPVTGSHQLQKNTVWGHIPSYGKEIFWSRTQHDKNWL